MIFLSVSYDKQGLYYYMAGRGNGFGRKMGRSIGTI